MLNRKNRLYKNCKKHGFRAEDKIRLDKFREECKNAIENAKINYLTKLGHKLNDLILPINLIGRSLIE